MRTICRSCWGSSRHLRAGQLEKLGLRYFFPQGENRDLARRVELGPPTFPPVPSFQLDRGRLENLLLAELRQSGVEVLDDCAVKQIALEPLNHTVGIETRDGQAREVRARWVVDASGRAGLIKRQLGLTRPADHGANACWFRVPERVMVDDWSDDPEWRARVPSGQRWLSTNHLMGRGYWVWLIPLGSGSTSIGIVADGDLHPFSRLNRFERALDWLREFEPQCAEVVETYQDRLEDFLALRHYAHACERVFSPDGWSLVGEAGVFTDPFYSPGSDFIAIGNDCAADLIVRTARGEDVRERAEAFNTNYLRLFDAFLRLYSGQYPLMGNAQVMTAKAAWDNGAYWAITGSSVLPAPVHAAGVHAVHRSADAAILRAARPHAAALPRLGSRRSKSVRGRVSERRQRGLPAAPSGEPRGAGDGRRDAAAETRGQLHAARSIRGNLAGTGSRSDARRSSVSFPERRIRFWTFPPLVLQPVAALAACRLEAFRQL